MTRADIRPGMRVRHRIENVTGVASSLHPTYNYAFIDPDPPRRAPRIWGFEVLEEVESPTLSLFGGDAA